MTSGRSNRDVALGPALRRAWVGYQRQLDAAMANAGFGERRFPDGRVLRMCAEADDMTTSQIGRELGITRQGAAKVVASLRDRGYVTVRPSAASGREKVVEPTPRALEYLAAQRKAAQAIARRLRRELGPDGFDALVALLDSLGGDGDLNMRAYIASRSGLEA